MAAAVDREAVGRRDGGGAGAQRLLLVRLQQRRDLPGHGSAREAPDVRKHLRGNRRSPELPDDRSKLWLDVKAQAVVDRVDGVRAEQAVAALAIGVVGDQVEKTDALEPGAVGRVLVRREVVLL